MMRRSLSFSISLIVAAIGSSPVLALEPEAIEVGAMDLIPTLNVDLTHTDNVYKDSVGAQSSNILVVNPALRGVIENEGGSSLDLGAQIYNGNYSISSEDDYTDWRLQGTADMILNARNGVILDAYAFDAHEARGTGFSSGGVLLINPDEYRDVYYGGTYQFGASENTYFSVGINKLDKTYSNNRIATIYRDRESVNWNAAFIWAVSPRTALSLEYADSDIDYNTDPTAVVGAGDSLDSDETYAYVGITWDATALTTGQLKLGTGEKEFSDVDRESTDKFSYEATIIWEPLTYSSVTLGASKKFGEATGIGNSALDTTLSLNWNHNWSDRLTTTLGYQNIDSDYAGSTRTEESDTFQFGGSFAVQRWLDLRIGVYSTDRSSSVERFSYEETGITAGLSLSL